MLFPICHQIYFDFYIIVAEIWIKSFPFTNVVIKFRKKVLLLLCVIPIIFIYCTWKCQMAFALIEHNLNALKTAENNFQLDFQRT